MPGLRVHLPANLDVAAIRKRTGLSQGSFANTIAVPVGTLRNWEQKRRQPEGPARVLLALLDRNPNLVAETLTPNSGIQGGPVVAQAGAQTGTARAYGRRAKA